jgi:hypothetical protein
MCRHAWSLAIVTQCLQINSFARQRIGLTDEESINFVFISSAVAIPARPIFGIIADRYLGPINTYSLNSIALGIMAFGWTGVHTRTDMYVFSCVMGFVNGASQGVFPGATSSLVTDVSNMGTWVGSEYFLPLGLGTCSREWERLLWELPILTCSFSGLRALWCRNFGRATSNGRHYRCEQRRLHLGSALGRLCCNRRRHALLRGVADCGPETGKRWRGQEVVLQSLSVDPGERVFDENIGPRYTLA